MDRWHEDCGQGFGVGVEHWLKAEPEGDGLEVSMQEMVRVSLVEVCLTLWFYA